MNELILLENLGKQFANKKSSQRRSFGLYKCFCGKEFKSQIQNVKNGNTKSCGCLKNKDKITHSLTNHKIYKIWNAMMQRCNNHKNIYYKNYGAIGITVCAEWLNPENFINDMFPSYMEGLSIDRIDNNLGYSKDNCRWATKTTQARNTRVLKSTNTTGYRGVVYNKANLNFISQIVINSKNIYLGSFDTAIEAAKAYDNYITTNNLEHTKNFIKTLDI